MTQAEFATKFGIPARDAAELGAGRTRPEGPARPGDDGEQHRWAALGKWISVAESIDTGKVAPLQREYRLDLGESEAILVAETLGNVPPLMDERRGVRCAGLRGVKVIRTPLIYAEDKNLGLVGSVREKLDQLKLQGFRLSDQHYKLILEKLGEELRSSE